MMVVKMAGTLTRSAYETLVKQNLDWLMRQPRTLERDHTISIVKDSVKKYYDEPVDTINIPRSHTLDRAFDDMVARQFADAVGLRTCNRHTDCEQADTDTMLGFGRLADHCKDEACDDCFGR